METEQEFYMCPYCFNVWEAPPERHEHEVIHYPGYPIGHQQLKPLVDVEGNLKTRAPRWFSMLKAPSTTTNPREDRQTRSISKHSEMIPRSASLAITPTLKWV